MAENARSRVWLWVLIGGGAFFLFVLAVFTMVYVALHAGGQQAGIHAFGDKIGVVDLDGVILDPNDVVDQLRKFGDDDSIKASRSGSNFWGRWYDSSPSFDPSQPANTGSGRSVRQR